MTSDKTQRYQQMKQTSPDDYRGSGFSRGHLCPSGDRLYSAAQNKQTFYLTNMQPQIQGHEMVAYGELEEKVRAWAGQCDTLYIVKAATIDKDEYICNQTDLEEMAQKENPTSHFISMVSYQSSSIWHYLHTTRKRTPIVLSVSGRLITTTVKASISPYRSYRTVLV